MTPRRPPWSNWRGSMTADYIHRIDAAAPGRGRLAWLDGDTAMNRGTLPAALRSAGAAILGVDLVMERESTTPPSAASARRVTTPGATPRRVLLLQQRGRRRRPRPGAPRLERVADRRLRCPPRQRHRGHLHRRPRGCSSARASSTPSTPAPAPTRRPPTSSTCPCRA